MGRASAPLNRCVLLLRGELGRSQALSERQYRPGLFGGRTDALVRSLCDAPRWYQDDTEPVQGYTSGVIAMAPQGFFSPPPALQARKVKEGRVKYSALRSAPPESQKA
ncbi:uncharacterized protein PGTG_09940 [Puccinia graminis f. sp. tritici CRL 75-36-700-3]|uniref:Uncharacterized protein n=1 Tax=Puccinia graminis f. sp. tritici (strain CRL 75-36-700-3 / race SCCL) TaxID=418459 RepID=E3KFE5_PUCGT|nr:uncharacterized protein PGTG_09940 [Puccinia graminis f. sp. tritici CRL 75-36-700-3]EFP82972.1 hypothetical protein PGTG_09940 [Puccinia graminis f. sp. tritici CRL 75-36-700-3]